MSKFTTEVRFICETEAGLSESKGYNDVAQIVEAARTHIFENFPIFDETYRPVLETNILRHYYTREIGFETVGLWKLHLNNRMREIMPKYNKLYESERLSFDPLSDTDLTTSKEGSNDKSSVKVSEGEVNKENVREYENSGSSTDETNRTRSNVSENENKVTSDVSANGSSETSKSQVDKYSETPQGGITGLESGNYLTNARIIDGNENDKSSSSQSSVSNGAGKLTENDDENITGSGSTQSSGNETLTSGQTDKRKDSDSANSIEKYFEHITGKRGGQTYAKMISEYRETFLNIDRMIINDLSDLFFGLWE